MGSAPTKGAHTTLPATFYTVCGEEWDRDNGSELRCFGLRRLAATWPRNGHRVTCLRCRKRVEACLNRQPRDGAWIAALETKVAHAHRGLELKRAARIRSRQARLDRANHARTPKDDTKCEYCRDPLKGQQRAICYKDKCRAAYARDNRIVKKAAKARKAADAKLES